MTEKFDKFVNEIITESEGRCTGPTLRQLSAKARYRWTACKENPYSSGYKRIYWGDKKYPLDLRKCARNPREGTSAYEDCNDYRNAVIKRIKKRRALLKKRNRNK